MSENILKFANLVGEENAAEAITQFPDMPEDEMIAMYFVAQVVREMAEATGMDEMDVYDQMFDGKDYTVKVVGTPDDFDVAIIFEEDDDAQEVQS